MRLQLASHRRVLSPLAGSVAAAVLLTQSFAHAQANAPVQVPSSATAEPAAANAPEAVPAPAPQQPAEGATGTTAPGVSTADLYPPTVSSAQQPTPPATTATPAAAAASEEGDSGQADQAAQEAAEDLNNDGGKVNIYGFADFTYNQLLSDRRAFNAGTHPYSSFYVGNLNIYLNTDLGHNWRSLTEFRLTYLPDGVGNTTYDAMGNSTYTRTSTAYPDYSDFDRNVKVGGVIIERAWVEYAAHPLLTIRGGQWLTPYGIWNVEHGTTVIVGTTRPYIIGAEMFPNHQTGLEMYGSYAVDSTQVGYHLTLSNGRGPIDAYKDLDKNKAIGWRLWLQQDTDFGTFVLGTSGYKGRYTDRTQTTAVENSALVYDYPVTSEYRELSLAADLKWNWKGALVQGEAIMHDVAYENGGRPAAFAPDAGPQGWTPDNRAYGFYVLAGYRLPWLGIMPYYGGEYYHVGRTSFAPVAQAFWGGVNIRPTDRVVLKIQETHATFPQGLIGLKAPGALNLLIAQVAWSF